MTRAVSVVLPSLERLGLLEDNLPPLLAELEKRSLGDEVVVVDDTGAGVLAPWLAERFPDVVAVTRETNGGFAAAMRSGVEHARRDLVFSMNTDVRVRPGFLDPLVACLEDEDVFAVVPRVLLQGDEDRIESLTTMELADGEATFRQPALAGELERPPFRPIEVAFAVGGTCLFRREDFLQGGGFDPLFEPFYWEDIDLCWSAWRRGRRTIYQPASVVEHLHRGTIAGLVPSEAIQAVLGKNRWLFLWKHLDDELLAGHVSALYRHVIDAWIGDRPEELVHLNLALEQLDQALAARKAAGPPALSFRELCERFTL